MKQSYPESKTVEQIDDYFGTKVADPYRWLEQPSHTPEVQSWIEAQNALTQQVLNKTVREAHKARLTELWDYAKEGAPFKKGERYFQFRNKGLENQSVLYKMPSPQALGTVLLDPNSFSEDGTISLNSYSFSQDGSLLAYAISQSGSDWLSWRVRDVETGEDLNDELEWSRFSTAAWLADNSGFYYKRYPQPKQGHEYVATLEHASLMLHKLGQAQSEDRLIYQQPEHPNWSFSPLVSDDGRYLIMYISRGTEPRNLVYYHDLEQEHESFRKLVVDWEAQYLFIANDETIFYFQTDLGADRRKLIAIDILNPEKENWHTVIAENQDTLQQTRLVGNEFICLYMQHARHVLKRFNLAGEYIADIGLPGLGSILELHGNRGDKEIFYSFQSFLCPPTSYHFNLETFESFQLSHVRLDFDAQCYITRQVFVTSKDGTSVPMFLSHRKDLELNGQNPTMLYGYGGFSVSLTPRFSVSRLAWLELGGVLAYANLRGGGEYGKRWHKAGTLAQKQNVFDDFIACAEWLHAQQISSADTLAVQGGSNGGLLVGAVMTQRPELFKAALPAVGVLDMLRYHKFTIGWAWASDYGSSDNEDEFEVLYAYSPLHNLKQNDYPATLITTADHDDRVVPAHSFKFAAALQKAQMGPSPILIRIQTKAGHGLGKPTHMLIDEQADILAFLSAALKLQSSKSPQNLLG